MQRAHCPLTTLLQNLPFIESARSEASEWLNSRYSDGIGWHIYCEVRLTLRLSASADDSDSRRFLFLLERFTAIADGEVAGIGGHILEHQGERLHFFLPGDIHQLPRIYSAMQRACNECYAQLAPIGGDHFKGFAAACDHGYTVFVPAITDEFPGVVSLSPSANEPAKALSNPSTVPAGHLGVSSDYLGLLGRGGSNYKWHPLPLKTEGGILTAKLAAFSAAFQVDQMPRIALRPMLEGAFASVSSPVRLQGWLMRADLDGFSALVRQAFAEWERGDARAIHRLLAYFDSVLRYPAAFRSRIDQINYLLPWAGDCANLIFLPPQGLTYPQARERTPAGLANKWHQTLDARSEGRRTWKSDMGGSATWAVGIAGGDDDDEDGGNNGILLVAPIRAGGRTFPVVAGWGARRSSDAYQQPWVVGTDTVLPWPHYTALSRKLRDAFEPVRDHPSYAKATLSRLAAAIEAESQHRLVPAIAIPAAPYLPAPRSYLAR